MRAESPCCNKLAGYRMLGRVILATLLLTLLMAGCSPAPKPDIRIGTNIWPGYEPLYLARSLGWFRESGIRLVEYTSATGTMNALRHGSIEAGALTLDEVLALTQEGVDLRVVLLLDVSNGADAVIAQAGIDTPEDLRGRTIGVESSAVGGYIVDRMLEKSGLSLRDVHILPLTLDEHELAFTSHRVDAVVTLEPVKSRLLAHGAKVIFDSSLIPGEIIDVLAVRSEVFNASPDAFAELTEKWFQALAYMQRQPDDAARRMQPRLRVSPDQLGEQYTGLQLGTLQLNQSFFNNAANPPIKKAEQLAQVMRDKGLLQRDLDLNRLFAARNMYANHGDRP